MASRNKEALIAALRADEDLRTRLSEAATPGDIERIAAEAGFPVSADEFVSRDPTEISEAELETVSGGYTFVRTDWVYCNNPWTDAYCTLKC